MISTVRNILELFKFPEISLQCVYFGNAKMYILFLGKPQIYFEHSVSFMAYKKM